MMMGTAEAPEQAARVTVSAKVPQHPALVVQDLTADDETGVQALCGLSLKVEAHEIVGIAGVSGNGQRELVQVLAGQREASGGRIRVHGEDYRATRQQMRSHRFHV